MKIALGLVFALALFLLPLSWGVHADDNGTQLQEASSTDASTTVSTPAAQSSGPFAFFRDFIVKHFMEKKAESDLDKANADTARSRFSEFQKKVEDFLKKLNNTSL